MGDIPMIEGNKCIVCNKEFEHDQYIVHCNECGDKAYDEMWERHERLYGQEGGEPI